MLVIDQDNWMLYEMFNSYEHNNGASWSAGEISSTPLRSPKDIVEVSL